MIEKTFLEQYATKTQTTLKNILREYCQHLFLYYFFKLKKSEKFFFKGGTALRLVFRSPRFSEDLDFTASSNSNIFENLLQETIINIEKEGILIELIESKKTTGGRLAKIELDLYGEKIKIKIEASQRKGKPLMGEEMIITSDFFHSYPVQILKKEFLIKEKIDAFLSRRKIRDFFDLYFILRARMGKEAVGNKVEEIIRVVRSSKENFTELKQFLPKNFWPIIKDFKKNLTRELQIFSP